MAQAFRSNRVLTPQGLMPATLIVESGRIEQVPSGTNQTSANHTHDFGDAVLLPGLIDTHVHINEPGRTEWEGFATATRAAASGGVTTLVDMPLNCVPETTSVAALEAKRAAADGKTWVDWATWGGAVRSNADCIKPLVAAGVPGFKCFLIHSGIDGFAWVDESALRAALAELQGTGLPLLAHAEIAGPVDAATARLHPSDWRNYATYLASRPDEAELDAIALLIRLAEEFPNPHPHRASFQRARVARAQRCAPTWLADHRRNLRSLPLLRRRRDSRRRNGVQVRAAHSRSRQSRATVACPGRGRHRFRGH